MKKKEKRPYFTLQCEDGKTLTVSRSETKINGKKQDEDDVIAFYSEKEETEKSTLFLSLNEAINLILALFELTEYEPK